MYHIIVNSLRVSDENDKRIAEVKSVFDRAGKQYTFFFTDHAGHAREIAAELTAGGEKTRIIAMGGDGTLHEILNGIKDPAKCKLGVIPVGSGNDFAAAVGIPENNVRYAAQIIAFRAPEFIDYIQLDPGPRSLNVVGCGMDVDVLRYAYAAKRNGKGKYIYGFFKSFLKYRARSFDVETDGGEKKNYNVLLACLGSGRQIGGGIKLFPRAKVDDKALDFLIVDYLSPLKTFIAFAKIFFGRLSSVKEVTAGKCRKMVIYPHADKFTIQAEGELYDYEHCEKISAEIVSGSLRFYIPHED